MPRRTLIILISSSFLLGLGVFLFFLLRPSAARSLRVLEWLRHASDHPEWAIHAGDRCPGAPFLLPTNGLVGYLWGDNFKFGRSHQGIDIFGGTAVDSTPVLAAYPGYLTRLPEWKASVIVRIPSDPLQPDRQIWTYYTHMADASGNSFISQDFPPGTQEKYIEAGTLLGYQGNFSGDPGNPVGVHLHFSIVLDDGQGSFRNELLIRNTLDPSPYLGLILNVANYHGQLITCNNAESN